MILLGGKKNIRNAVENRKRSTDISKKYNAQVRRDNYYKYNTRRF